MDKSPNESKHASAKNQGGKSLPPLSPAQIADRIGKPVKSVNPSKRRRLVLIITISATLAVGGMFWYFNFFKNKMITTGFDNFQLPASIVIATTVEETQLQKSVSGIGTVEALNQVTISSEIGGKISNILFTPGTFVAAGTPLVQIDDAMQKAQLAGLAAQLKVAKLNLERTRSLADKSFAAQSAVDQLETQLEMAQSNYDAMSVVVNQKLIRAPFSGVLGVRKIQLGQYISPGTPMVSLSNLSSIFVNFTLPEEERQKLAVGQKVVIKSTASPDLEFSGKLSAIEPQIDINSRQISLQATVANDGRKLYPGMYLDVTLGLTQKTDALTIPETAVDYSLYGESVYRIVALTAAELKANADAAAKNTFAKKDPNVKPPAFKVERIVIKTGSKINGRVEVVSGLKRGDRVVAAGQNRIRDQAAVFISNETSPLIAPEKMAKP